MSKTKEKNTALELRKKGESIKDIAKKVGVSKSTTSYWCRDIELTLKQKKILHTKMIRGGYLGRIKGARIQYKRRIEKIKRFKEEGIKKIDKLSERDLLIAGLALYWGEGSKRRRVVSLSNSDPEVIKFTIRFFEKIFGITKKEFTAYIGINQIHKKRVKEVEDYWSKNTGISKKQFSKTTLIKAKNKKNYSNFPVHYGTFTIRIKKSGNLYYRIMGLIKGLEKVSYEPGSRMGSKAVS